MSILAELVKHLSGFLDWKPNTEHALTFGGTTLTFTRLWGRSDVHDGVATLVFDDPKPVANGTKFLIPWTTEINSLEISADKVLANTVSLGQHQIYP